MRRTSLARLLLVLTLLLGASALGGRRLGEFQEGDPLTPEEIAQAKQRSRSNIGDYGRDNTAQVAPFPWKMALLLGIALVVAVPFALGAYRRTAIELKNSNTVGSKARQRPDA